MLSLRLIKNEDVAVESRSRKEADRNNQREATEFPETHYEKTWIAMFARRTYRNAGY